MCTCNAFELEADSDEAGTFWSVEQSPAGVTWTYDWNDGQLGYIDDDFNFVPRVEITYGDSGPDEIRELVVIDEDFLWLRSLGGILRIPVEDLGTPGLTIHTGVGIVAFELFADYKFHTSGDVHDFDIVDGFVWWIEGRTVFKMAVSDFDGTPTEVFDLTAHYGTFDEFAAHDMLIAAASDRLWVVRDLENPIFRAYEFNGDLIEAVPVESSPGVRPTDMTVERDTDVLVVASHQGSF